MYRWVLFDFHLKLCSSSEFSLSLDMPKIEPSLQRSHVLGKPTNASLPVPWTGRKNGEQFFQQKLGMSPVTIWPNMVAKDAGQTWWFSDVFRSPKSDPYPAHGVGQRIDTAWWTPVGLPKRASTRKHNLQAIQSDLSSSWFEVTKKPWNHKCHK